MRADAVCGSGMRRFTLTPSPLPRCGSGEGTSFADYSFLLDPRDRLLVQPGILDCQRDVVAEDPPEGRLAL
jgi:hypothetical protein